jgi:hypothetical protein
MTRTRPATGGATLVPPRGGTTVTGAHGIRYQRGPSPPGPAQLSQFSSQSCFCQTLAQARRAAAGRFRQNRQPGPLRPALRRARVAAAISYVCGRGAGAGAAGKGPAVRLSSRGHGLVPRASPRQLPLSHKLRCGFEAQACFGRRPVDQLRGFPGPFTQSAGFCGKGCCRTVPQCAGGFADVAHLYQSQRAPSEQAAFAHVRGLPGCRRGRAPEPL